MASLIEKLPARIARLEEKHGSDDPFVKDLKEQLRAMKANVGKSTQDVYRMQAASFQPKDEPAESPVESTKPRSVGTGTPEMKARMKRANEEFRKSVEEAFKGGVDLSQYSD